jgi:hypothetical protein
VGAGCHALAPRLWFFFSLIPRVPANARSHRGEVLIHQAPIA